MTLLRSLPLCLTAACFGNSEINLPEPIFDYHEQMTGGELTFINADPVENNYDWDAAEVDIPMLFDQQTQAPIISPFAEFLFSEADNTPTDISIFAMEEIPIEYIDGENQGVSLGTHVWSAQLMGCSVDVTLTFDTFMDREFCEGNFRSWTAEQARFKVAAYLTDFDQHIDNVECEGNGGIMRSLLRGRANNYPELCIEIAMTLTHPETLALSEL